MDGERANWETLGVCTPHVGVRGMTGCALLHSVRLGLYFAVRKGVAAGR